MSGRVTALAAFVLAVCFVLPLSTCTRYVDDKGNAVQVEEGQKPPQGAIAIKDRQIAAEELWTNPIFGVPALIAFMGPLAGVLYARFGRSAGVKRALFWLQPLFLLVAGYVVWVIGRWGDPDPPAFAAGAAIAVLLAGWMRAVASRPAPA